MAQYNFDTIFLGNFTDVDINEGDQDAENAANLLGSYTDIPKVSLTVNDVNDDGILYDNEIGPSEAITYDAGSGSTFSTLDSSLEYSVIVTRGDGTTYNATAITYQFVNGDVFVLGDILEGESVQAIELVSVVKSDYGGASASDKSFTFDIVCLTSGTLIQTSDGKKPVEAIKPGDMVETLTDGYQSLLMLGSQTCRPTEKTAAITFEQGSLGNGLPVRTLRVSPQHRILMSSPIARRMVGSDNALTAAKNLVDLPGIKREETKDTVTYWHMLFSRHQVIRANGVWVESLLIAPMSLKALPAISRMKISGLRHALDTERMGEPVFPILKGAQIKNYVRRSALNSKPLVGPVKNSSAERVTQRTRAA